ncbi:hypothetical protein K488DRAFT_74944 [Vararia minispora EC-137]|uniref:Uncharacterized protein n=1 Tax=Vararia minispora EC-137 TaxID=1314806 RepID=A0ACB8Q5C9_9AGAM|nr:hypothetical protein K488DRAFT_74944 [Vararia minispora EC-137]
MAYGWVKKKKPAPAPQLPLSTLMPVEYPDNLPTQLDPPPLPHCPATLTKPNVQRKQIYEFATRWDTETVVFCAHTLFSLPLPTAYKASCVELLDCSTPYLACIPIQPHYRHTYDIHFCEASILDWEQSPVNPGCWRVKSAVYKQLKAKAGHRAHDFVLTMTVTLTMLWSGSIRSWVDFLAVWNTHQCAVAEFEGFSYFCAVCLPPFDEVALVSRHLRHPELPQWGVIITMADITDYYNFFCDLRVPGFKWCLLVPVGTAPPSRNDVSSQAAQAAQKERKKQQEKQHEVALLKRPHTNAMRYSTLPGGTHKAFQHILDMLRNPPMLYLPRPIPTYDYAQQIVWQNVNLLNMAKNKTEFTFFLHTYIFWSIADNDRLARYARQPFSLDQFWIRDDDTIFGKTGTAAILKGKGIELGCLGCDCDATKEKVKDDQELIAAIVYTTNVHNLLHQLMYLVQPGLEKLSHFPAISLQNNSYLFIPDFCIKENLDKPLLEGPLLPTLARVILGEDGRVQTNGRVVFFDFAQDEAQIRRKHIDHLIDFFVMNADPDVNQFFQKYGSKARDVIVSSVQVEELDDVNVEELKAHLLERWFISCLQKGQWPCKLYKRPKEYTDWCRECRKGCWEGERVDSVGKEPAGDDELLELSELSDKNSDQGSEYQGSE